MESEHNTTATTTTVDLTGLPEPVVRSIQQLVESLRGAPPAQPAPRPPLVGRFAHLGISISKEELDEAQREAWSTFPRDFPEPDPK